ncbi:methyltransferase [Sorangium sp. So ce291]|uniref:methyltransferase n=1 Tax=Sorangium sp. So ce291 TaxID=3133294 RepID=UPI003F634EA6
MHDFGNPLSKRRMVAGARDNLEQMGVLDRCELTGGDFLVSVPGGDACVISHVLHNWGDENARTLLTNCRKGLRPGGKLIVLDAVIRSDNKPSLGKFMDMQMLILFDGHERTEDEFASLYRDTGFELTRVVPTRSSTSVIEGVAV